MWKMWKRIICCIVTAAIIFTELPMDVLAASNTATPETESGVYGDANGDGRLDANDITLMLRYIAEDNPSGLQWASADVNGDGAVDLKDLLAVKEYLSKEILSVSFYDGDRLIDTLLVEKGSPLGAVPSAGRSSRDDAILTGYFTDQACTVPFYADNPVMENMKVYARYQEMEGVTEELNYTSFAQMDLSPDVTFTIRRASGNISPESAAELIVKDGSDPVALEITGPDGDGVYVVRAPEGFRRGASYELKLAEGWVFDGKEETIRTAAFSVEMEEVSNLRMSDSIRYIEDTDTIDYVVGGIVHDELAVDNVTASGGSITYDAADASQFTGIVYDDILCVYVGTHPLERNAKNGQELLDPIVYVKVTGIDDGTVSFTQVGSDDQVRMYDIPDNYPVALSVSGSDPGKTISVSGNDPEKTEKPGGETAGNTEKPGGETAGNTEEPGSEAAGNTEESGGAAGSTEESGGEASGNLEEAFRDVSGMANDISGNNPGNTDRAEAGKSEKPGGAAVSGRTAATLKWEPDLEADQGTMTLEELTAYLDLDMYRLMMGDEELEAMDIAEKVSVGDFITFYSSSDEILSEESLYYAQITDYNEETQVISYAKTTKQAILESMDLYEKAVVQGDDLVTEEQKAEMEALLLSQMEQSGFAEEAAYLLSDMITRTNGFRDNMSVQEFLLTDENGNPLTEEEIELLNLGGSFELSDDVKLKVELITKGDQLHFGGGVQLAVSVEAEFEVEVEDGKVAINLSATFVQEVAISPSVRGGIVTKEILFIPVPVGVEVNAAIDVRSYTAFSFAAEIYTVAEEDKDLWEQFQEIAKNPKKLLEVDGLPLSDEVKKGLETAGDVMNKIDEIQGKIDQAFDTAEKIQGYEADLETLWNLAEGNGLTTREEWEQMGEAFHKTSIASDLMDMMNLSTDTEISTEYLDSVQALMDKYTETVQKETDWVQLVNQEIMAREIYIGVTPIVIGVEVDFVVRADMSIAIGSNLEYEVGKRYNFWFKIGLFKPSAGSSSMDLIDERFAFQFYVMGKLGLKAGIYAKLYVGLGSGKLASVGITAELGPYIKLYGFFVYEYKKYRPANSQIAETAERMAGALYLEFGLYFKLGFEANALGDLFEYSYDFLDEEFPLLTAGEARYYYQTDYKPEPDDMVIVRDEDGNSTNGITMTVPDSVIALSYVDLDTGWQGSEALDYNRYYFTVSNPNFEIDPETGVISVDVPENTRYMECDLTATYRYGKLAFSRYDMTVTIPLVWTNLSTDELKEFYTASVRVGNDRDGYQTVWSRRVLKNQEYDLPTDEEIREMIGWSEAKYTGGAGYGSQETKGLTLVRDTVYDYNVDFKTYSVTVTGIQNVDGTTREETFTAKYGERFDFSSLAESGTEIPGVTYMKFAGVKTNAVILAGGRQGQVIDLTEEISGNAAAAIDEGIAAWAEYVDDSVAVSFEFTGIDYDSVAQRIRKGTTPELDILSEAEEKGGEAGLNLLNITPDCSLKIYASTVYQAVFGELTGPKATVTFHENGGSDVADITKAVGGYLGRLPVPDRKGYSFGGWYTDDGSFQDQYAEKTMPEEGADLYARWTANEYTVSFHVNGGNELDEAQRTMTVTYDSPYGSMPVPSKSGYAFIGWFTAAEGGAQVTADTGVSITERQTLYAHWRQLITIPSSVFDFGDAEGGVYQKGTTHEVIYSFDAGGANFTQDEFTIRYMRQGNSEYETGLPINAGTYNATLSRPADDYYDKFEYTYTAVITIDKAVRTIGAVELEAEDAGYTYISVRLVGDGGIDDLSDEAAFTYQAKDSNGRVIKYGADRDSHIYDLLPETSYDITVKVTGDPNYYDAESTEGTSVSTLDIPEDTWLDGHYSTAWLYHPKDENTYTLETAADLAGLAFLVYVRHNRFDQKTIVLAEDIDLRGHKWVPIGKDAWRFNGTFDGGNHRITGLVINGGEKYSGLFGQTDSSAQISNVILDHSYIYHRGYYDGGNSAVGGIVANPSGGSSYNNPSVIDNCVNAARIRCDGSRGGGIAGDCQGKGLVIRNCVNYGYISGVNSSTREIGGIAGYVQESQLRNNANFGTVWSTGESTGGIVGQNDKEGGASYNSYNAGWVRGAKAYTGAIIGRNEKDKGSVRQVYYLYHSATGNGAYRNAAGNSKGADDDDHKHVEAAYFTSPTSNLSRNCEGYGTANLITVLNAYVKKNKDTGAAEWVEGEWGGYPIPKGSQIPEALKIRMEQQPK